MGMCQSGPKASAQRAKELHTQIQTEDWPGPCDRGLSVPPGLGTLGMGSCPRCGERAVGRPGLLPGGEKPEPLGDSAYKQAPGPGLVKGWGRPPGRSSCLRLQRSQECPLQAAKSFPGPPAPRAGHAGPARSFQLGGGSADRRLKIALPAPPVLSPLPAGVRLSGPRTGSEGPSGSVQRGTKP